MKVCKGGLIIVVVWVDDVVAAYSKLCMQEYEAFRKLFRETFNLNELGPVRDYLGMMVTRDRGNHALRFNCSDNIN